ncbi:MAG: hypothetical protein AB1505_34185 [Candidatus Latescibacterota bacterium]
MGHETRIERPSGSAPRPAPDLDEPHPRPGSVAPCRGRRPGWAPPRMTAGRLSAALRRWLGVVGSAAVLLLPLRSTAGSLDLGASGYGVSFGNSREWTGLRLNLRDEGVRQVRGLNVTLWKSGRRATGVFSGVQLGLVGPEGATLNGLAVGGLGTGAHRALRGVAIAGMGAGAGGDLTGVALAGLGAGAGGDLTGIALAGLGTGTGGDLRGLAAGLVGAGTGGDGWGLILGGIGAGVGHDLHGAALGGVGAGVGGDLTGVVGGLVGAGVGGTLRGLGFGGAGVGAGKDLVGIGLGGLCVGAGGRLCGLAVGLGGVRADEGIQGIALSAISTGAPTQEGICVGLLNGYVFEDFWFRRRNEGTAGLTVGLVNYAPSLRGVQLGLLNYAGNNPRWARLLPLLNAHW